MPLNLFFLMQSSSERTICYMSSPHIVDTMLYFLYYNVLVTFDSAYAIGANK